MKKTIVFLLLVSLLLCSCSSVKKVQESSNGFIDEKNEIEYVVCSPFAIKPITIGDAYCSDGTDTFYQIQYEDPTEFLCDFDKASGSSYVYRNSTLDDITIENFHGISAMVYLDGTSPVLVDQFYADDEYLPEEKQGLNGQQETYLVKEISEALTNEEEVFVPDDDTASSDMYEIRLLSADYPGLYYSVIFFADLSGNHYLEDMATFKVVLCPEDVEARMIG